MQLDESQSATAEIRGGVQQQVAHERGVRRVGVDAVSRFRRERQGRDVDLADRQGLVDAGVQFDLDGIVGVLAERDGRWPIGGTQADVPRHLEFRDVAHRPQHLQRAIAIASAYQQVDVAHRPLAVAEEAHGQQRGALHGQHRNLLRAAGLIQLRQQAGDASLSQHALPPLVGQEGLPDGRALPVQPAVQQPRDAMHHRGGHRDAPFEIGPGRRQRARRRDFAGQSFRRLAQCRADHAVRRQRGVSLLHGHFSSGRIACPMPRCEHFHDRSHVRQATP